MGKQKKDRRLGDNEARAVVRNLRVSPRKLNLVAQLIRGKKVDAALADLEFSRKRIAQDVRKCVMSAVANAENNHRLDVNDLVVTEAHVGKNIVMRRFHARGRGRMSPIEKPFSQLTVVVRQVEEQEDSKDARRRTRGSRERAAAAAAARTAAGKETEAKETA